MVALDRKFLRDFDWELLLAALMLITFGIIEIHSAEPQMEYWKKQLFWSIIALFVMLTVALIDYRKLHKLSPYYYIAIITCLVLVLIIGKKVNGQRAWINLGAFDFQPSQMARMASILVLARMFGAPRKGPLSMREIVTACLLVGLPVGLIMLQPDAGMALTFVPVLAALLFFSGIDRKLVIYAVLLVAVSIPLGYYATVQKGLFLKPYQIERIQSVIHPELADRRGFGYQTYQSMIAVGSGGLFGKGIGKSTQGRLGFIPERHNDFIAAVASEETGFIGSIMLLLVYLFILLRCIQTAQLARDRFGTLAILGFVAVVFFHIMCNVGMVVGFLPVMGITLPLMSYGGSSLLETAMGIGFVMSVRLRRFVN